MVTRCTAVPPELVGAIVTLLILATTLSFWFVVLDPHIRRMRAGRRPE